MTITLHSFHRAAEAFYLGDMQGERMFADSTGFQFDHDITGWLVAPIASKWFAQVSLGDMTYDCSFESMADALDWMAERVNSLHRWLARAQEAHEYYN